MNAPLVVFGEDWGSHPSSTQHLICRLTERRPVLWVNSIGLRRPRLTAGDFRRAVAKAAAACRSSEAGEVRQRPTNGASTPLQVLDPLAIPASSHPLLRRVNRSLLAGMVRRSLRRHSLSRPILWTSLPTAVDVIGALDERAVVYYCGDDWEAMPGVDHGPVSRLERELAGKADLVLAASPAIAAKFPAQKTVLLPHGADISAFAAEDAQRPTDLPSGGPIAGYYGTVSEWLDIALLTVVATALPNWTFFLIGPVRTDVRALEPLPNVIFAGPRKHSALPGYARHWNVSLMPFRDTAQIRASNPLKLREYLAAGTPLVTTDFPALDGYRDLVEIARTPDAFAAAICRAEAEGRRRAHVRVDRVAGETWEARARQVEEMISEI